MRGDLLDTAGETRDTRGPASRQGFARAAGDGCAGSVGLPAAEVTTSTARAIHGQRNMAELGRIAVGATHQPAIDHGPAADAR